MDENKKYYWLKLHDDLFTSKRIKKLRKLGADFFVIYLKLQLISLKNNGVLEYTGIESTFAEELSLEIDEDADKIQVTLAYLQSCDLLVSKDENEFFLPYVEYCTGSETASAMRVRKHREKQKALQCNTNVTQCNAIETECNTEIEIEKEIEKEKEIDIEIDKESKKKSCRFVAPTIDEIKDYCWEKQYPVKMAENFYYYYDSKNWMVGKNKMSNWKSALSGWANREKDFKGKEKVDSVSMVDNFV